MWISNIVGAMRLWSLLCAVICFVYIFVIREISSQIFVSNHIRHFMGKWIMFKLNDTYSDISHYNYVYNSKTASILQEAGNTYPSRAPQFFGGTHVAHLLVFWIPCCDVHYDFCIKIMLSSSLSPVLCRRVHVLFTLYVFVYILFCVFDLYFFVLCALWCQYLWVIHFGGPGGSMS